MASTVYISFNPTDNTFWLGDSGNLRSLHFSSATPPVFVEKIAWVPLFYSGYLCRNDPTRVFAMYCEYAIDYTKPLSSGWTLVNNWSYTPAGTLHQLSATHGGMAHAITLSGGTYCAIRVIAPGDDHVEIYEMATGGLRYTGKRFDTSNIAPSGGNAAYMTIDPDGHLSMLPQSLNYAPGLHNTWYRQALTGFTPVSGGQNPNWSGTWVAGPSTPVLAPTDPQNGATFVELNATSGGTLAVFDGRTNYFEIPTAKNVTFPGGNLVLDTAHGLVVGQQVKFWTVGSLPGGITPGMIYYVATVPDVDHYSVSLTAGGSSITLVGSGSPTTTRYTIQQEGFHFGGVVASTGAWKFKTGLTT